MTLGKRLTGAVLAALGFIGLIICVAGFAGVWIAGARLQRVNAEVFRGVDELVTLVDRRAEQANVAVNGTRDIAGELKQTLQGAATELVAERVKSLPEIEHLEQRLTSAMERADGLLEVSASTTELVENLLRQVGVDASERYIDPNKLGELEETIQSTRKVLASANDRLTEVQRRMVEIRQERDADVYRELVAELTLGVVAKLDVVQDHLTTFRHRLDGLKGRLAQARDRVRTWIFAGQFAMVFLLLWIGAGQYCLLRQGWRFLRQSPAY